MLLRGHQRMRLAHVTPPETSRSKHPLPPFGAKSCDSKKHRGLKARPLLFLLPLHRLLLFPDLRQILLDVLLRILSVESDVRGTRVRDR